MEIDRRLLLIGGTCAAIARTFRSVDANGSPFAAIRGTGQWQPLTRSLLERARRANASRETSDRVVIERTIRQFIDASALTKPLIIKWMDTPSDSIDHLSRFGLDALLDMGTANLWHWAQSLGACGGDAFNRAIEARMVAAELLGVEDHDHALMAPKLLKKSQAKSASAPNEEVFRIRAIAAQIGWLETSMADVAARAVGNIELLLSTESPDGSVAIDNQLRIFGLHEHGLLATWETEDTLICVPRLRI